MSRLFFAFFLRNRLSATRSGKIYPPACRHPTISPLPLAPLCRMTPEDVEGFGRELQGAGLIVLYEVDGELYARFPSFHRRQPRLSAGSDYTKRRFYPGPNDEEPDNFAIPWQEVKATARALAGNRVQKKKEKEKEKENGERRTACDLEKTEDKSSLQNRIVEHKPRRAMRPESHSAQSAQPNTHR